MALAHCPEPLTVFDRWGIATRRQKLARGEWVRPVADKLRLTGRARSLGQVLRLRPEETNCPDVGELIEVSGRLPPGDKILGATTR